MMLTRRALVFAPPLLAMAARKLPVGAQTNAWQDPPDFDGFLALLGRMKKLGYEGFETHVRNVQSQAASAAAARARIQKSGLTFFGAHFGMQVKFEPLEQAVDVASACGAQALVLSGGGAFRGPKLTDEQIKAKSEYLDRAGAYCRKRGMKLAYHNHAQEFQENGAQMEGLLAHTDPALVSLLLDAGWAAAGGTDPARFIEKHSKRIAGLHLRDYRGKQPAVLGEGEFDHRPVAAAVRKTAWHGWLLVEPELRSKDLEAGDAILRADREYVRKVFGG